MCAKFPLNGLRGYGVVAQNLPMYLTYSHNLSNTLPGHYFDGSLSLSDTILNVVETQLILA